MGKKTDAAVDYALELAAKVGCLVPAKGQRKNTDVSRREAVAIAHGMAAGIAVGAGIVARREVPDADVLDAAAMLFTDVLDEYPEHRDDMLSRAEKYAKCMITVGIEE